jgi:hypothetical protein
MKKILFDLSHTLISLSLVALFADNFWVGFALAVGFLFGREQAQAEYKWIEHYGNGKRANMKWWNAFEPKVWDFHSWFWNLSFPIAVMIVFKVFGDFL